MKSAYIHIPFCEHICSYCDFCKILYQQPLVESYLHALEQEIKEEYQGEILETIYIGGGTPSALTVLELDHLFSILSILKRTDTCEITIECNIENLTLEKMKLFFSYGVNRLSIGVQTSHEKYLKILNRNHTKIEIQEKIREAKKIGFFNINLDFIYALPGETIEEVKEDISFFLECDIPHISTYSLMIEPHTTLYIKNVKPIHEDKDANMYQIICDLLEEKGFQHYETSNFCKSGYASLHNLTYWNNEQYYGFGLGASSYIRNVRATNTRSLEDYKQQRQKLEIEVLTTEEEMENELILGFRKIEGISKEKFQQKFSKNLLEIPIIQKLIKEGKLLETKTHIRIDKKYLYVANQILVQLIGIFYE